MGLSKKITKDKTEQIVFILFMGAMGSYFIGGFFFIVRNLYNV